MDIKFFKKENGLFKLDESTEFGKAIGLLHNHLVSFQMNDEDEYKKYKNVNRKLEDIVNQGYYLGKNAIPTENARKYIDFVHYKNILYHIIL